MIFRFLIGDFTPEATGSEETSAPRGAVQETHLVTWAKEAKELFWALGSFKRQMLKIFESLEGCDFFL